MQPAAEKKAETLDVELQSHAREAFKIFVEIYKHHFDLWLKAYLAYLAIIGVVAGILFKPDTPIASRNFLIIFVAAISLLAVIAWIIGIVWIKLFERTLGQLSTVANLPLFGLFAFKFVVFVGLVGSIVISVAALVLLRS